MLAQGAVDLVIGAGAMRLVAIGGDGVGDGGAARVRLDLAEGPDGAEVGPVGRGEGAEAVLWGADLEGEAAGAVTGRRGRAGGGERPGGPPREPPPPARRPGP